MTFGGHVFNVHGTEVNRAFSYKISTKVWTEVAPMRTGRYGAACGPAGPNRVIVAGGSPSRQSSEIYDIASNTWTPGETASYTFLVDPLTSGGLCTHC